MTKQILKPVNLRAVYIAQQRIYAPLPMVASGFATFFILPASLRSLFGKIKNVIYAQNVGRNGQDF
jgi:hypothetical protein